MRTIPKSFECGPHTITVEIDPSLAEQTDALGLAVHTAQKIILQKPNKAFTKESQIQTFCHELTHTILDTMGEIGLSHNERFVEGFSQLLYQFLKTKKHK